jgi:hypothetical protein
MIDIFDIIDGQKVVHINIEGEVSSDGLFFDIEYINELTSLLLDNQKDVEFKIFDVKEYKDSEPLRIDRFGMYGAGFQYERAISNIEFRIDVRITNRLNRKIDESMQDFIDFFTKGAIVYNNKKYNRMDDLVQGFVDYATGANTFTVDAQEEYMSSPLDDGLLSYMYSWEEDNNEWSGIGSYPLREYRERHHDADGDAATAVFASRLMGIPNGMEYQIDPGEIIGRPVRGGRF